VFLFALLRTVFNQFVKLATFVAAIVVLSTEGMIQKKMKWSMDHVLTGVVRVKNANCYNIAVYCHVVLDEGERRKKGFLCF
jgi:DNA/RNA endonuclease G (NUC1)